jgi:putative transposase
MSKKRKVYSAEFKTKLVLEVLKNDKTLNQVASENNITPKNLQNWKKTFLDNAEIAMEPARAVKEYKNQIKDLEAKNDQYAKIVGKLTVERDWLSKKVGSLGLKIKKSLVEPKLKNISITRQCKLIKLNRSSLYYKSRINQRKNNLLMHINSIYEKLPIYGAAKVHRQLLEDGYRVCVNTVSKYRNELGLKAILALKNINTTTINKENKKYSYKLKGLDITRANQVWSTDITYIKTKDGFVYLSAVIDWFSKAILSYSISNTMDENFVVGTLNKALLHNGKPEIFNTDQGSVYTGNSHTKLLALNGIVISMDSVGRATDNIAIERFWRSIKCERIYLNEYNSIEELKIDIADYINFYNNKRFHQSLDYKKPMDVYYDSLQANARKLNNLDQNVA